MAGQPHRLPLRGQPVPGTMTEPPPSSGEHPLLERSHLPGVNLNCASHRPEDGSRCYTTSTPERVSTPTALAHTDPQSGSSCGHTNAVDDIPTKEEKNQTNERMATPVRQHGTSPPTSPSSTWNPQPSTIEYEGRPHQVRADERPRSRSPSVTFLTVSYGADERLVRYQFVIDERTQCMALRNAMDRADDYLHGIPHPRVYGPYGPNDARSTNDTVSQDGSRPTTPSRQGDETSLGRRHDDRKTPSSRLRNNKQEATLRGGPWPRATSRRRQRAGRCSAP